MTSCLVVVESGIVAFWVSLSTEGVLEVAEEELLLVEVLLVLLEGRVPLDLLAAAAAVVAARAACGAFALAWLEQATCL